MQQHHVLRAHLHVEGKLLIDSDVLLLHADLRDAPLSEIAHIVRCQVLGELEILPLIQDTAG